MKPIVFANQDESEKVTVNVENDGDDLKFSVVFEPAFGLQTENSTHLNLAMHFLQSLKASI